MSDKKYWAGLSHFLKFGPVRFKKLANFFPDMESAFNSKLSDLIEAGLETSIAEEFIGFRAQIDVESIWEKLNNENIKILTLADPLYPKLLAQIYDPPSLIYYKGDAAALAEFSIAIVGSRKYSPYGQQVCEHLARDLAQNKLTIVSGLAYGIDTLAHHAALAAGGKTVAVLASGLDRQNIYPTPNRYLADKITASQGVLISEFPYGAPPLRHHFPQRNRLISGLSLATLVIEAGEKSGALITGQHALDQNREVFAVPGNIYSPTSAGTNNLIKLGARLVTNATDILEALNLAQISSFLQTQKILPESVEEKMILANLNYEPKHIDALIGLTKLDASTINSTLAMMEMKGMIKNLGGMQYVLAR